jgi:Outer membrane protein beta-barrel domain
MKKLILLITVICITEFSFSQTNYRNGYVITNARDTLFGLVDYREGAKAYKSCDFKIAKGQSTITYEPGNIIGYGFENDKFFQSKEISIKDQPPKVVFLEVIVMGLVSLYKFEDTYFIEKDNNGLQQLLNETKEVYVDGKRVLKSTNQHIGTINMLVYDCAEIKTKVQKIRLDEKTLTNLVEDYNRCKGEASITFKDKKPWTKAIVGMTGGINISQLNFNLNQGYEHLAGDFEVSKSPMIGVSLDILSPRLSERISFHGDLLYLTSKYYNYNLFNISSYTETNYITIELQQLKIPIGFRYTFPKRNITPYFSIGISSTIHLSSNSKWIQEVESNGVVETYSNEALPIKENQLGLWGGCGVLKSISNKLNVFVELRYEQTDGVALNQINTQADLQSKITNFQILIGIRTK